MRHFSILIRYVLLFILCLDGTLRATGGEVRLYDGHHPITYNLPSWSKHPVTEVAAGMLAEDLEMVTGQRPITTPISDATVKIFNLSTCTPAEIKALNKAGVKTAKLSGTKEGFTLKVHRGALYVVGADDRGTTYGILEVSRLAGVSPWVWWNDATPSRKDKITLPGNYEITQSPSVEYRGIFLNDEDWSLQPWSWQTHDPGQKPGTISAKTYREIFKLLLRLRANTIWPAMHDHTVPFYFVDGAKETADSCGIVIGTSHCEPLLRNNVGEWNVAERGPYNYITNRDNVLDYWAERLVEAGMNENMYTIGMRGIHDGNMEGVKTMEERVTALQQVINDQRELLATHVNPDVTAIPQIFVPYKEVLEIMDNGLTVPDDITLIWCDDNYGHISRLSDTEQQRRSGGAGVYYHLSYWGRPHDYLWLGTTQPGLVCNEMREAYANNARRVWIVNVHDMKTSSYGMELFLDMAWDIDAVNPSTVESHLGAWLKREFGEEARGELLPVMQEYYRLTAMRRPEHMGWSQVELSNRKAYPRGRSQVTDTEFSFTEMGNEADRYINDYKRIVSRVEELERTIAPERRDTYFAQIKYPVLSAAAMAEKSLEAQRARSYAMGQSDSTLWGRDSLMLGACARSQKAYQRIRQLTRFYNDSLAGGKWHHAISATPRDLYVFNPPILPVALTDDECEHYASHHPSNTVTTPSDDITALNAADHTSSTGHPSVISMLGHSMKAVKLPTGDSLTYGFNTSNAGEAEVVIALIPTQPIDNGDLRVSVSIDEGEPQVISYREKGRTDTWKENVLRNQARITLTRPLTSGPHTITVKALDPHVILDQLLITPLPHRPHYTIPTLDAHLMHRKHNHFVP